MKISVVSASFNSGRYIKKAAESVLRQGHHGVEYIVIDGGSTDGTLDILKKYESRIRLVSEKDNGLYDALNKGFKMAKGEVLTWLDTDNYYLADDVIEKVMNEFEQSNELEMVVTNTKTIYEDGSEQLNQAPAAPSFEMFLQKGNKFVPEGVFFRKELFEKAGGLDVRYKLLADYELWLKMLKLKPKIKKLEVASAAFTVRQDALLRKDPFAAWRETCLIGKEYGWSRWKLFCFHLRYFTERLRFFLAPAWRKVIRKKQS